MTTKPARTCLAALLASTLLLAGCGGDSDDSDAKPESKSSSTSSSTTTEESSAATPSSGGDAGSSDLDKTTFYAAITKAQKDAGSYRSTSLTTLAGQTSELDLEATYEGDKLLGHSQSKPGSTPSLESVVADGVIYLKGDGLGAPAGKWLKIDSRDPATAQGPYAGLAGAADPEVALKAIGELDSLVLAGPETIDGVETRHYRAVMVTANYADVLGLPAEAAKLLPAKLPFDMWIDAKNRPVQFKLAFEIDGQRSSTEQKYFDYGVPIDVTVPADSDTVPPTNPTP